MRRLLFAVAIAAAPLAAQQPSIGVEMRDGRVESIPLQLAPTANVIVEFRDAPLAQLAVRSTRVPAVYGANFQRLRDDVASIEHAEVGWEYFRTFRGASVSVPRASLSKLRALSYVKAVYPDVEMHALADPVPPANVKQVRADALWAAFGTLGKGVVVAIIDTGIDYTHPALAGRVIGGYDFVNKDDDPMDDHLHGTHVAGIVAGNNGGAVVGVAPEASLIAYKVLNASGNGRESDIIAAIERTVDPNLDGNTSDHVDVANLSLGGTGGPDDALSRAVDNATTLGVVFAIAAGNSGSGHTIASPGSARSAITVGAVDSGDLMASFSSRGPNNQDLAVKPEVVAPGVSIFSSLPGNRYGFLSGTSMATPHVAGVAALLRAVHRDWSPARIKAAMMATAAGVNNEVMATGAGRIDAAGAAGGTLVADPPGLTFGLDTPSQTTFSATRQVRITNNGASTVTLVPTSAAKAGQKVTFDPTSFTLAPGASRDVSVTVEVTNATIVTGATSFSGGGQADFGALHVPFGFVKAARATVTFDRGSQTTLWFAKSLFTIGSSLNDRTSETLLKPGTYDYFIYDVGVDETTGAPNDVRFVYRESQTIDGDAKIDVGSDAAPHFITFGGRDENGLPLASQKGYASWGRLFLHPDWQTASLHLPALPLSSMRISDLSTPKLSITEGVYDVAARHFVFVHHPLVTQPDGDVVLTTGGAALTAANVHLFTPPGFVPFIAVQTAMQTQTSADDQAPSIRALLLEPGTIDTVLRLVMNAPPVDGYGTQVTFSAGADNATWYSEAVVTTGNKIVPAPFTAPKIADGFDFTFGYGPLLIVGAFGTWSTNQFIYNPNIVGQAGEVRSIDSVTLSTDVRAPDGNTSHVLFPGPRAVTYDKPGTYRIDNVARGMLVGGVPRMVTLSDTFDPSRTDATPPLFTSLALLDGAGRITRTIEPNGVGALRFSVADFTNSSALAVANYQQVSTDATKAFYRVHGAADWLPIDAVATGEDRGDGHTTAAGLIYRIDLAALARRGRALYDVRVDAADTAGNTSSITVEPAFSVGPEILPRGRAVR